MSHFCIWIFLWFTQKYSGSTKVVSRKQYFVESVRESETLWKRITCTIQTPSIKQNRYSKLLSRQFTCGFKYCFEPQIALSIRTSNQKTIGWKIYQQSILISQSIYISIYTRLSSNMGSHKYQTKLQEDKNKIAICFKNDHCLIWIWMTTKVILYIECRKKSASLQKNSK